MLTDGNHKPGSVKMGYYALHFLFTNIYHKEWAKEYLPTPKVAQTLPLVLSRDEVSEVLGAIDNFKHRAIIMLIYSTGARVSESVNIKLADIDSRRMQANIQEGKGLKQRQVPLSPVLLSVLPKGFFKVRYYGILSSRYRKQNIETAKQLLAMETENQNEDTLEDGRQIWEKPIVYSAEQQRLSSTRIKTQLSQKIETAQPPKKAVVNSILLPFFGTQLCLNS